MLFSFISSLFCIFWYVCRNKSSWHVHAVFNVAEIVAETCTHQWCLCLLCTRGCQLCIGSLVPVIRVGDSHFESVYFYCNILHSGGISEGTSGPDADPAGEDAWNKHWPQDPPAQRSLSGSFPLPTVQPSFPLPLSPSLLHSTPMMSVKFFLLSTSAIILSKSSHVVTEINCQRTAVCM